MPSAGYYIRLRQLAREPRSQDGALILRLPSVACVARHVCSSQLVVSHIQALRPNNLSINFLGSFKSSLRELLSLSVTVALGWLRLSSLSFASARGGETGSALVVLVRSLIIRRDKSRRSVSPQPKHLNEQNANDWMDSCGSICATSISSVHAKQRIRSPKAVDDRKRGSNFSRHRIA